MIGEDFKEPDDKGKKMETAVKEKPVKQRNDDTPPPVSTIESKVVLGNVLRQLGKPHNMCQISPSLTRATPVTQSSFRVNIYTAEDRGHFTSQVLSHTFFVKVDENGKIVSSNPEIIKHYE